MVGMTIAEYAKNCKSIHFTNVIKEFYGEELMRCVELEGGSLEVDTLAMQYDFKNISESLSKRITEFKDAKLKNGSSARE